MWPKSILHKLVGISRKCEQSFARSHTQAKSYGHHDSSVFRHPKSSLC